MCGTGHGQLALLSHVRFEIILLLQPFCIGSSLFPFFRHTRGRSGKLHNTGYKDRQRVNGLGSTTGIEGKAIEQRVRKLLGAFNHY
jgi:hypothetical protein